MVISMAGAGEPVRIEKVIGRDDTIRYLKSLGFVEGEPAKIICDMGGNVIVEVKDSRIALDRQLANKIIVTLRRERNEDIESGEIGAECQGYQNRRRRRGEAAHHGHGHHKGMRGYAKEGSAIGGPAGGHGQGL